MADQQAVSADVRDVVLQLLRDALRFSKSGAYSQFTTLGYTEARIESVIVKLEQNDAYAVPELAWVPTFAPESQTQAESGGLFS